MALALLARTDVAHDAGEVPPPLERPLGQGKIERDLGSVFAASFDLTADIDDLAHASCDIRCDIAVVLRSYRLGHEQGNILADHFVAAIPEDFFG